VAGKGTHFGTGGAKHKTLSRGMGASEQKRCDTVMSTRLLRGAMGVKNGVKGS